MTELIGYQGDITRYPSEVIVNAANPSLLGGGGVDGAIHRAAGGELLEACRALGGANPGEAKLTDAFDIASARKIVHTVGPVYRAAGAERAAELLASCYRNSLDLAKGYRSVAFPAISTGVYGYPIRDATVVAIAAITEWLARNPDTALEKITLIAFGPSDFEVIRGLLAPGGDAGRART
jgi:O-acetyl-ADP-ribose deacetylase (regulator of RNase III)